VLFGLSLLAEVLSNDEPLVARHEGKWYFPIVQTLPETSFGGDFATPTDYLDPLIQQNLSRGDNFAVFPLNRYHHSTINYFASEPSPAKPSRENCWQRRSGTRPARAAALRLSPVVLRSSSRRSFPDRDVVRRDQPFRRLDGYRMERFNRSGAMPRSTC
jgi:hypothetical protein